MKLIDHFPLCKVVVTKAAWSMRAKTHVQFYLFKNETQAEEDHGLSDPIDEFYLSAKTADLYGMIYPEISQALRETFEVYSGSLSDYANDCSWYIHIAKYHPRARIGSILKGGKVIWQVW